MADIITTPDGWNDAILRLHGGFLQSWEWGEFQRAVGSDVMRLREPGTGALGQFVRRPLPFGKSYWYCPRGPLGLPSEDFFAKDLFPHAAFLRLEPLEISAVQKCPVGPIRTQAVQPPQTLILDLTKSEEELLAAMHEKTRYNIRLAERKGVRVYRASGKGDSFDVFWSIMEETASRDAFRQHGKEYYRRMLGTFPYAKLMFAEHDGRVLAANLMVEFGGAATYLHGASSNVRREVMAPHLLHWECIKAAKAAGFARYDFWGVAPPDAPDHPWAGISRFKRGFGGTYVAYPGAFDLPVDRFWYTLYALARRTRP